MTFLIISAICLLFVSISSSEFRGQCNDLYGRPKLINCIVAVHKLSQIHSPRTLIRFVSGHDYRVVGISRDGFEVLSTHSIDSVAHGDCELFVYNASPDPSIYSPLIWSDIVEVAMTLKDSCLPIGRPGTGGINLNSPQLPRVSITMSERRDPQQSQEGGQVRVPFTTIPRELITRLELLNRLLNQGQEPSPATDDVIRAEPDKPHPRDGSESKACRDEKSCETASACVVEKIPDPLMMYGSALLAKVGHCLSLPNLLQDFLRVIDSKV